MYMHIGDGKRDERACYSRCPIPIPYSFTNVLCVLIPKHVYGVIVEWRYISSYCIDRHCILDTRVPRGGRSEKHQKT